MRNRLLISALHIPLPGRFFPENIFNIHLLAPPSPLSRLHPHYIFLPAILITFTKPFLLIKRIWHNFFLQPAIPRTTPLSSPIVVVTPLVVVPSWLHKGYLSVLANPEVVLKFQLTIGIFFHSALKRVTIHSWNNLFIPALWNTCVPGEAKKKIKNLSLVFHLSMKSKYL